MLDSKYGNGKLEYKKYSREWKIKQSMKNDFLPSKQASCIINGVFRIIKRG